MNTQNLEEASTIASEFIYSIDNLPNEVQFLLQEIKHKEARAQELQQEIDKDSAKYIRHSLRAAASISSSTTTTTTTTTTTNTTTPSTTTTTSNTTSSSSSATASSPASRAPSPKSSLLPSKIASSYAEIHQLAAEKCVLAQRLIDLINRTRSRLDYDLSKVRLLQGGEPLDYGTPTKLNGVGGLGGVGAGAGAGAAGGGGGGGGGGGSGGGGAGGLVVEGFGMGGVRNPAFHISESLRTALRASPSGGTDGTGASSSIAASATKRRRLGTTASIKLTTTPTRRRSASPATTTTTTHTHQRSRLSRQVLPPEESEEEVEAEENTEMEDVDAEEDDKIYCFCQKKSFGDMIACDNEGACPYEWFHLSCVGLKQPTPEKWYCSVCSANLAKGSTGTTRKGRKK
ncbi:hypothetical protein AX17_001838 [Amanita inopinata Kibby_2008]|nr:hypothetical protein AX17_001838 [Amanita inopinata Kibby_2008]